MRLFKNFSRTFIWILGKIGAIILGLIFICALLAILRLPQGPISLNAFAPSLYRILEAQVPAYKIDFADAGLFWSPRRALQIRVRDVAIAPQQNPDDEDALIRIPAISLVPDVTALLFGDLRLQRLQLVRPSLRITRDREGRISWVDDPAKDSTSQPNLSFLTDFLTEDSGGLQQLEIVDADISFVDDVQRTEWISPETNVVISKTDSGYDWRADSLLDLGVDRTQVTFSGTLSAALRPGPISWRIEDLQPAVFTTWAPAKAAPWFQMLEVSLTGHGQVEWAGADGQLDFSQPLADILGPVTFEVTAANGHYRPLTDQSVADQSVAEIKTLALSGRYLRQRLTLHKLDMEIQPTTQQAPLQVHNASDIDIALDAFSARGRLLVPGPVNIATVKQLWPEQAGAIAKRWVTRNMLAGEAHNLQLTLDLEQEDFTEAATKAEAFQLDFNFANTAANLWQGLPPAEAAVGVGRLNRHDFELTIESGKIGTVDVRHGHMLIADIHKKIGTVLTAAATATGALSATLAALNKPPIRAADRLRVPREALKGSVDVNIALTLPLKRDILLSDLDYDARFDLWNFTTALGEPRFTANNGKLQLVAKPEGIKASGSVFVNEVPFDITWSRPTDVPQGSPKGRVVLTSVLSADQRRALYLAFADEVDGPIPIRIDLATDEVKQVRIDADADLTEANISLAGLKYNKTASDPARLNLSLDVQQETDFTPFTFHYDDQSALSIRANGRLDSRFEIVRADLPEIFLHGEQLSGVIEPRADGTQRIKLRAGDLDIRPFIEADAPPDQKDDAATPPREIMISAERLLLPEDIYLADAALTIDLQGQSMQRSLLRGLVNGTAPVSASISPLENGRRLNLYSANAGQLLDALSITKTAESGTFRMTTEILNSQTSHGNLSIDNIQFTEAPVLAQLLTLGSLTGLADTLGGAGIGFTRIAADFTLQDDLVNIQEARAIGPAMAIHAEGNIGIGEERSLDIEGLLVPATTVNTLLGKIPILGQILAGRNREGVFAMDFSVKGNAKAPEVSVNPLSALAPGILRDFVDALEAGGAAESVEDPWKSQLNDR